MENDVEFAGVRPSVGINLSMGTFILSRGACAKLCALLVMVGAVQYGLKAHAGGLD